MKKNIVIAVLAVISLGLVGYIVYDKTNDKNEVNKQTGNKDNIEIIHEKIDSFDEDIYYYVRYLDTLSGYLFSYETNKVDLETYNKKDDETIKYYLYSYYRDSASKYDLSAASSEGAYYTYNVSKKELDKITNMVFGKEGLNDYSLTIVGYSGIKKIDDENYQISWSPVGGGLSILQNPTFEYYDDRVEISSYIFVSGGDGGSGQDRYIEGKVKFVLKYNKTDKLYYLSNVELVD